MSSLHTLESLLFTVLKKWECIPVIREAAINNITKYMNMLYGDLNNEVIDTTELLDQLVGLSKVSYITSEILIQEQRLPLFYKYIYKGIDLLDDDEDTETEDKPHGLLRVDSTETTGLSVMETMDGASMIGATVPLEDFKKLVTKLRFQ